MLRLICMILPMEQINKPVLIFLIGPLPNYRLLTIYTEFYFAQSLNSDKTNYRNTSYFYAFKGENSFTVVRSTLKGKNS